MCTIYNTIGSLNHIKTHLQQHNIEGFNSIKELLLFQKDYDRDRAQLIANQKALLIAERDILSADISLLEKEIIHDRLTLQDKYRQKIEVLQLQYNSFVDAEKTVLQEFTYSFKALFTLMRVMYTNICSAYFISRAIKPKSKVLTYKQQRHRYLISHFEDAATAATVVALTELDRKKKVIDEINLSIYGAIGEQKVVDELAQLSDEYTLINDFRFTFAKSLYYKQQSTHIKTIQIDHVLISQAGVFLIETKNWSEKSVQNLNLRSPVTQIHRSNFALYHLLKETSGKIGKHHWGERKIPIRNLIVLINHKPQEEFQYVKILTLSELLGYVEYFQSTMSAKEAQGIADYLIELNT
ncbi:MAG TPA: nuclease-related domain-containing protein [Cyclobacteriaceae bacterium]|jgi:hypothetical protein|nr:NERD domain-containing protein [Cytophagales bacterium]HCR53013.1 hypothetical protein [Cytophagales bacterium]HMR56311.1 nuclease-related domain-containing protein [Cyclobacteriaceae bacterium]HRE66880.1 nuclease-related domain-containing protein [Cyclobacteriaceae bacterium]HRF34438.1 nuclease-related domain-containing protein [Cyclobacteriaceae bacterium]